MCNSDLWTQTKKESRALMGEEPQWGLHGGPTVRKRQTGFLAQRLTTLPGPGQVLNLLSSNSSDSTCFFAVSGVTWFPIQWQSHCIYRDPLLSVTLGYNRIKPCHHKLDYLLMAFLVIPAIFLALYLRLTGLKHYSRANSDVDYKYKHNF